MKTSEVLRAASLLPYVDGHYAVDAAGAIVDAKEPTACKFCTVGAVAHVAGLSAIHAVDGHPALTALRKALPDDDAENTPYDDKDAIIGFSDNASPEERAAWWNRAIESAELEEAGAPE